MIRQEKIEELRTYMEELKTKKILKQQPVNKGFLSIKQYVCELNNGKIIKREQIIKNKQDGSAVIILPITKEGNTLLVVQPRVFTEKSVGLELPAGYIEKGEEAIASASRELAEETGYVPESIEFLAKYYQDQGCSKAMNHSFVALGCEKVKNQLLDSDEFIRYFECSYDELLELVSLGYINSANDLLTIKLAEEKIANYIVEGKGMVKRKE